MELLVKALGPAFAAGFAIQRLLELLDPAVNKIVGAPDNKRLILGTVSLVAGLVLAFGARLRVLQPLGLTNADVLDAIVTGLIISAGTEGINSIMKFLGYAKDSQKAEAQSKAGAPGQRRPARR